MMDNDIIAAINVMRAKLDEIEKMVNTLPFEIPSTSITSGYSPTPKFRDWCDIHGIEKDSKRRRAFFQVAKMADEGLTADQIKNHRRIRLRKTIVPLVDGFFAKWQQHKPRP
jgi:hypothetical protein